MLDPTALKTPKSSAQFHDFDDFERLVEAAKQLDALTYLIVLLGVKRASAAAR